MASSYYHPPVSFLLTPYKEAIDSKEFKENKGPCSFVVGKDKDNRVVVEDLAKLRNLLVIGAGGCGKTSFLDSLIMSLLYKYSPNELKLVLMSPKLNEFGVYSALPHLYCPIITEPLKAGGVLRWVVLEAEQRYTRISKMGCRTIERYNALVGSDNKLPRMVVIIDGVELLQLGYGDYEESLYDALCRCHEVGIHFVITVSHLGFNTFSLRCQSAIPNRVSFRTVTTRQSRVGIGVEGAERLAGIGKCLLSTIFSPGPVELQAYKVELRCIEDVVWFFENMPTEIPKDDILPIIDPRGYDNGKWPDELLPDAVRVVMESGSASISMIQRRLRVGYARSARLVDIMEQMGIVSSFDGSKPRKILIDESGYRALFSDIENRNDGEDPKIHGEAGSGQKDNKNRVVDEQPKEIEDARSAARNNLEEKINSGSMSVNQKRALELAELISDLNTRKTSLGLFKRKERKLLQEQIDQVAAELKSITRKT